jgi:phage baseplate assembly protein W
MALSVQDPISWPFLPVPDASGVLSYPTLDQSVRDAIRIILMTSPGEQLMAPYFGAGLRDFLDEGNTVAVRRQIQGVVLASLQQYEKRITVDAVDVTPVDGDPTSVHVQIQYRVLRTNTSGQIGATLQTG